MNPCRSFHLFRAANSVPASYIRSFTNPFIQKPTSSHCEQTITRNSQVETGIQTIRSIEDETSKKFAALAALAQKYAPAAEFNAIVAPMSADLAKVKYLIRTGLACLTDIGHHWRMCHCKSHGRRPRHSQQIQSSSIPHQVIDHYRWIVDESREAWRRHRVRTSGCKWPSASSKGYPSYRVVHCQYHVRDSAVPTNHV